MSTLKENFRNLFKNHFQKGKEEELLLNAVDDDLEKIADDYAIEFADWLLIDPGDNSMEKCTTKELLEIFKKEKGY